MFFPLSYHHVLDVQAAWPGNDVRNWATRLEGKEVSAFGTYELQHMVWLLNV